MARNDRTTAGPYWTKHWIEKMWRFTAENFVNFDTGDVDFEALGREEYEFRKALFYRNFKNSERAKEAFAETEEGYKSHVESGKKGGRPRKNQETTADAPTREDGEFKSDSGDAGNLESATSANISVNDGCSRQNRRTGADSLRSDCHSAPVRLPDFVEFTQFVDQQGLDYTDAREWWEMTMVDRDGHDRDGKPIRNWKITCRRFCEAKAKNRRSA